MEIAPLARRQIKKLPGEGQTRNTARIGVLGSDPRPCHVKKLVTDEDLYRVGVGEYRVIHQIRDRELIVLIVKVGHRREVHP